MTLSYRGDEKTGEILMSIETMPRTKLIRPNGESVWELIAKAQIATSQERELLVNRLIPMAWDDEQAWERVIELLGEMSDAA